MLHEFDTIISLGANCQTRYHLQLHSKRKYGKDLSVSYFFDWVWRQGSIDGTISWLEQRLDLATTTWGLHAVGDAWEVKANEYGSLFPHDFAFTSNNREACEVEMQAQMDNFLAKYAYLRNRTFKAIRASDKLALLCNSAIGKEHYERLEKLIVKRFGKNDFTIFSFPDHKIAANQTFFGSRLVTVPVSAAPWPGHSESWANALQAIDLSFSSHPEQQ